MSPYSCFDHVLFSLLQKMILKKQLNPNVNIPIKYLRISYYNNQNPPNKF